MEPKTGIKGLSENVKLKYLPNVANILNDKFAGDKTESSKTKYLLLIAMMRKRN